jgi:hypothetical protein
MHVWNTGNLLYDRRAAEALDRHRHVVGHWLGQPGADWSQ